MATVSRHGSFFAAGITVVASFVTAQPATALTVLHHQCQAHRTNPVQAIEACTGLIRLNTDSPRNMTLTYLHRAAAWMKQGNPGQAVQDATSALQLSPGKPQALVMRGHAFRKLRDINQARANFDQAIAADPSHAPAYSGRAVLHLGSRDYDRAIMDADAAIRLDSNLAVAYGVRGTARVHKRDIAHAFSDLNRALQLNPQMTDAYNARGLAHKARGDLNAAAADFDRALAMDPSHLPTLQNRAVVRRMLRQFAASLDDLNRAISLNPRESNSFRERGITHLEAGDFVRSLPDLNEAIRLDRTNAEAFAIRGKVLEKKGETRAALADFAAALAIDQNHAGALAGRGRISAAENALAKQMPVVQLVQAPSAVKPTNPSEGRTAAISKPMPNVTVGTTAKPAAKIETLVVAQANAAPIQAAQAATLTIRPLKDTVAACEKAARPQSDLAIDRAGGKGKLSFPTCYRGRAHADCVLGAILEEAAAISHDYGDIVKANYSDLTDVAAICKIDPRQIDEHLAKAGVFNDRASALQKAYESSGACVSGVQKAVSEIDLSAMNDSQKLLLSIRGAIGASLEQASARQKDIFRLMQAIRDAQKSMTTVRSVRATVCK
ncbi:tetratricopeptide repeat protein [Bradyrhizobium sp.]|uniref:tetratricopeptide repeat protein n=1 Tax=Bradyrhizobium sp. TaxID=376 RepID=UPI004037796D